MQAKHAVLFKTETLGMPHLLWLNPDEKYAWQALIGDFETFAELLDLASKCEFTHLWIHESAGINPDKAWCEYDEEAWDLRLTFNSADKLKSAHGWRLPSGGQKSFDIIFPRFTRWSKGNKGQPAWGALANPKQLLMTIKYLETATGVTIGASPAGAGWQMIKGNKAEQLKDIPKLAGKHFEARAAFDLIRKRPLTSEERTKKYLLKFDKNSAYLSAAAQESYGIGQPVHNLIYSENAVGVWRVTVHTIGNAPFQLVNLGEKWLAAPIVRLLRATGYEVQIHEGYTFLNKTALLAAWANKVWAARQSFREDKETWPHEQSRLYALEGMKQIAVGTVGLTGYHGFTEEEESDKKRPDIKLQTVARTCELMTHNIIKVERIDGVKTCLVATDAGYVLADTTNPREVCPTYLEREGKLGGMKYEGYIEVTPEVLEILDDMTKPVSAKLKILNKIGWKMPEVQSNG